jgi:RHS repeat-associated protein
LAVAGTAEEILAMPTSDPLNRTESPLSHEGKWQALSWASGTAAGRDTSSGWGPLDAYSTINGAYWIPSLSADTKNGNAAAITMQVAPGSAGRYVSLWLNMSTSSKSGYQLRWTVNSGSNYTVKLSKWASGTETVLASNASVTIPTGTTMAISDTGGTVTAWKVEGGSVSSLLSASDSTYGSGRAGIEASGNISRSTSFKAGPLPGSNLLLMPVTDPLNRTENPLSYEGKWQLLKWAAKTGQDTTTGWANVSNYPTADGAYWSPASSSDTGGNAAAITMATGPGYEERYQALWLNMPTPGSAKSGYQLHWMINPGYAGYTIKLSKWSSGTETVLASNSSATIASGSTLAISDSGGVITAWQGSGGSLSTILSANDSTYSEGHGGIEVSGGYSPRLVDFKTGSLVVAPNTELKEGPAGTAFPDVSFSFASTQLDSTFECQIDGGAYGACTSPKAYQGLSEGSHTFRVRAKNAFGSTDTTPAESTFQVLEVGKAIAKVPLRDDFERNESVLNKPNWTQWGPNATVSVGSGYESYSGWDAAHYWNPKTFTDLGGPVIVSSIVGQKAAPAEQHLALWLGISNPSPKSGYEARFEGVDGSQSNYKVELSKWASGTRTVLASKTGFSLAVGDTIVLADFGDELALWTGTTSFAQALVADDDTYSSGYAGLEVDGGWPAQHHFRAGNRDTQAPNTSISSGPFGTVFPDVSFSFTSTESESTFECQMDGGAYGSCASPKDYKALAEGSHTFKVRAIDNVGNQDPTPAERTFTVIDPPETTITSPRPTYTSHEKFPITFTTDEPSGAWFECRLDTGPYKVCSSPDSLLSTVDSGWHTFYVRAYDSVGNVDPTAAVWTFNVDIYSPAPSSSKLTSPEEGTRSNHYFTLKAQWGNPPEGGGVTGVTFQAMAVGDKQFKTIPPQYVLNSKGEQVSWPLPVASNPGETEQVYFDARSYPPIWNGIIFSEKVKLRAVFDGGTKAAGASVPVQAELSVRNSGPHNAAATVGPATVDLLTGYYTMSKTDVSIPVPGTEAALEFARTYSSNYIGQKVSTEVLDGAWQPSLPAEQENGGAWRVLIKQHVDAVAAEYDAECEEEEGAGAEVCMIEEALPAADWIEILDSEEMGIFFDKVGSSYPSPEYAKDLTLTEESSTQFRLTDTNGTRTTFIQSTGNEFTPRTISFQASAKSVRMVYEFKEGELLLTKVIGPTPTGVSECPDTNPQKTAGCRSLSFQYAEERLRSITYHPSTGVEADKKVVIEYEYDGYGRLVEVTDPRTGLAEKYTYSEAASESRLLDTVTPPGVEPYEFGYDETFYTTRLRTVKQASLVAEHPVAQTTIVYDVPLSGEDAPYDMSPATVAEWGQTDYPVDATAIFPPSDVPSEPPSDYSHAAIHYLDPSGNEVNTAAAAPPGASGPSISTAETDLKGNIVRSLSAQSRLLALEDEDPVTRAKELDSHSTYNADGTRMLQSWGPLHEIKLANGETKEARAHTEVEYDKDFTQTEAEKAANAPFPNLPTKETTGAAIPGEEKDKEVSVTETKYDWNLRKPIETIVDPGEGNLNLIAKTVYYPEESASAGLVKETRQPSDAAGVNAGTTKTVYYTASANADQPGCGSKAAWAGLPCVTHPLADPSPAESNPKLPWNWYTKYSKLDEPEETQEKTSGVLKRTTTMTYDSVGRPVKTKITGTEGTLIPEVETIYKESTGAPEIQRFICKTAEECGGSLDTQELKTTYDELGRITKYEDADGGKSEVAYDFMGRPVIASDGKGTQTLTYDEDTGQPTKLVDSAAGTFTATYNADGKMTEQVLPNGLAQQIAYDEEGTAVGLKYQKVSGCESNCTWLQFDRELSIAGQVLKETGTLATKEYSYDKAGRLTLVKDTEGGKCTTRAYAFEGTVGKNSNRTSKTVRAPKEGGGCDTESAGTKTSYGYDTADRLIGEGTTYDSLGRITSLPSKYSGGGTLSTTYYVNDLTRSQIQDGLTNTYYLDAGFRQRERVQSGSKSGAEVYHYSTGSDSPAWTQEGANWTRNIAAMGSALGALQKSSGEITFQLADMHGDIVGIAESNPSATKLKSTLSFDEFGNPKQGSTPKFGWLGASGRRTELPSGVIQMGMRSYVPALGRFLTMDPIRGGSANAYDYANQDPVNNFDLTGECAHKKKSCQQKKTKELKRRAHRKAKKHSMRRLAAASRNRGGGARASYVPPLPWDIFGADMREKVGGAAANVSVVVADAIFDRLKQGGIYVAQTAVNEVMATLERFRTIGSWVTAHRTQVEGCVSGAIEGAMESAWILGFGPKGAAAMGLFVAVSCGVGWLTAE